MAATYVYAENTNDYCLSCAADSYAVMGLRPRGRRREDITLEDLIEYETGGPRRPLREIWSGRQPVFS